MPRIPRKNIEKWREDWTKVVQVKHTLTTSYSRGREGQRRTSTITISVAKQYDNEAKEILKTVTEIIKEAVRGG